MNECRQLPCRVCLTLTPYPALNTYGECDTCAVIMNLRRTLEKQGKIVDGDSNGYYHNREARLPHND